MDAGFVDEEGFLYIMSRSDDVINVAGHRLSAGALEEVRGQQLRISLHLYPLLTCVCFAVSDAASQRGRLRRGGSRGLAEGSRSLGPVRTQDW